MSTTIKMDAGQIAGLRAELEASGFEFRPLDYGHFQARGDGVVVAAYKSGKVVVQGKGADAFLERNGLKPRPAPALKGPVAGSDESGKGDYFGPLVVAAVVVAPGQVDELAALGVRDCKKMADATALRAAAAIRKLCPHAVCALSPEKYNARHEAEGNVALFLSTMHAKAVAGAVGKAQACARVVIDKFTSSERLEEALEKEGVALPVEIRHRAEDNPAVAAASVLARAEFLIGLKELGHPFGVELPKGASRKVEAVARSIFQAGGMEALASVAKVHFKTTGRVTGELF